MGWGGIRRESAIGFYSLETTRYTNQPRVLNVRATDSTGNVAVLSDATVTIPTELGNGP